MENKNNDIAAPFRLRSVKSTLLVILGVIIFILPEIFTTFAKVPLPRYKDIILTSAGLIFLVFGTFFLIHHHLERRRNIQQKGK